MVELSRNPDSIRHRRCQTCDVEWKGNSNSLCWSCTTNDTSAVIKNRFTDAIPNAAESTFELVPEEETFTL